MKRTQFVRHTLEIRWPWWIHPSWALLLLTGSMAALSIALPASAYAVWGSPKFLDPTLSMMLLVGLAATFFGITLTSGHAARGGSVTLHFTDEQIGFLSRAYKVLLALTLVGYALWIGSAVSQGATFSDLSAVLSRQEGALSTLKDASAPIAGLTTLTQFGPLAVTVAVLLRRLRNRGGSGIVAILLLSAVRTVFYAERLALLEVLVPLILAFALTTGNTSKWRGLIRAAPLLIAPLIWMLFAISEYARSWVVYQRVTSAPFYDWVTLRLVGYYTTSFNNSALFASLHEHSGSVVPYFSVEAFWNAPLISAVVSPPSIMGIPAESWWNYVLTAHANPELNSVGSFLVTQGEFGTVGMILFWFTAGMLLGAIFSAMTKGSLPALLAYSGLFIGILELSRFIYWTQGRATPIILGVLVLAFGYQQMPGVGLKTKRAGRSLRNPRSGLGAGTDGIHSGRSV